MATSQHSPTRRAVLGALPAMALIGTGAAVAVHAAEPDASTFNRRVAAYRRAVADYEAQHAREVMPAYQWHSAARARFGAGSDQERRADAAYDAAQARFDRLVDRAWRRVDLVFRTPAPNHAALADKIEIVIADEAWNRADNEDIFAALLADARRLGGEA